MMPRSPVPLASRRPTLVSLPAVVLAALLLALLPTGPAHAAEAGLSGGRLDWGIKSSFLTYLTGPTAQGGWSLSGGASTVGTDQFRFHSATGTYHPDTGSVTARYAGAVHMTGHQEESGEHALDLTVGNPSLDLTGSTGTLHADVRSRDRATGEVSDRTAVPLAHLDLTGVDLAGGGTLSVTGVPATLTAEGATAFGGFYEAGEPLDPLTFTADPVPDTADDEESAPEEEVAAPPEQDADPVTGRQEVTGAIVDWGVRRTFREFVTGELTEGSWEMTGPAEDGGAVYRFPEGTGTHDADAGTLTAAFDGGVRFTGHALDLSLASFTVVVEDGTGTLSAEVTDHTGDGGPDGVAVPLVTFPTGEPAPEDGLLHIDEAPAELTAEGADAFGLYAAGAAMDPVTVAVPLDDGAELPPLPDLGSEPAADGPDAGSASEPADDTEESAGTATPATPLLVTGGVAAALGALAVAGYLRLRRRTRAAPMGAAAPDPRGSGDDAGSAGTAPETAPKETP